MIIGKSYIYGCWGIYLKSEPAFGFDRDGELFFLARMDLITGNFGDELKNIENLPLNLQPKTPAGKKVYGAQKSFAAFSRKIPIEFNANLFPQKS